MSEGPRYLAVARDLKNAIQAGRHPVGSMLPTEVELCRTYDISRHTARDALRRLRDEGLIARRRGAGTTVIATGATPVFAQPLGGLDALLQYARDTRLELQGIALDTLGEEEAADLGRAAGETWLLLQGVRRATEGPPLATTRVYVRADLATLGPEMLEWPRAFSELIEARTDVRVARVEQHITAVPLDADQAKKLRARTGQPALRTVRRYFDANDRLVLASDSIHPGDRFVYAQNYKRDSSGG